MLNLLKKYCNMSWWCVVSFIWWLGATLNTLSTSWILIPYLSSSSWKLTQLSTTKQCHHHFHCQALVFAELLRYFVIFCCLSTLQSFNKLSTHLQILGKPWCGVWYNFFENSAFITFATKNNLMFLWCKFCQ